MMLSHQVALLFGGLLLRLVSGSRPNSGHSIRPNHIIKTVGNNAEFTCETEILHPAPHWILSGARQPLTDPVFEGSIKEHYKEKLKVEEWINEGVRVTQLTINNVTMQDAGTVFCREDGAFGQVTSAKLSVVHDNKCTVSCADDRLLVACTTCYWSEDKLDLLLHYHGDFKPNLSSEDFDDSMNCLQLDSIWAITTQCNNLDESKISITLLNNSATANFSYFSILRSDTQAREERKLTNCPQPIDCIGLHVDLATSEPKDNETDNRSIFIIFFSTAAFASLLLNVIFLISIVVILVKMKRKFNSANEYRRYVTDPRIELMSEELQTIGLPLTNSRIPSNPENAYRH